MEGTQAQASTLTSLWTRSPPLLEDPHNSQAHQVLLLLTPGALGVGRS